MQRLPNLIRRILLDEMDTRYRDLDLIGPAPTELPLGTGEDRTGLCVDKKIFTMRATSSPKGGWSGLVYERGTETSMCSTTPMISGPIALYSIQSIGNVFLLSVCRPGRAWENRC